MSASRGLKIQTKKIAEEKLDSPILLPCRVGGFRGGAKGPCPLPQDAKVAFFA